MADKAKISTKQAYTLFLLAVFSPLIRLVSTSGGGRAGWVSLIISCGIFCGLVALLGAYFKHKNNADLYSLYKSAFGKIIAKILVLVYAGWVFILAGFYLRAFGEKFAGLIMPGVPAGFFKITLLALIFIILSGKFQSFALLSNVFFYVVLLALGSVFFLQIPRIHHENLLPVTQYDVQNIMLGTLPTLGIFVYLTPLMFLGDEIEKKHRFKKFGFFSALVLLGAGLVIFVTTVGVFGKDLAATMEQPFLMSVKTMGAQGALERLESVFLLLWVVTDLAIIVMFLHILLKLISLLTGEERGEPCKVYKSPILLGVYVLSLVSVLGERMGLMISLGLGLGVPVIAIMIYRLKTLFSKSLSKSDTLPTAPAQSQSDQAQAAQSETRATTAPKTSRTE
jgi:spore germination protein (amino acid permease)